VTGRFPTLAIRTQTIPCFRCSEWSGGTISAVIRSLGRSRRATQTDTPNAKSYTSTAAQGAAASTSSEPGMDPRLAAPPPGQWPPETAVILG
jgi:hypothetical protein